MLRRLTPDDALFMLLLLNDESFVHFVGDRGLRTEDDARAYLLNGPIASYERHGYGMYLTALKSDGRPAGICGLVRRDVLDAPDVGFAFLPEYRRLGYAHESASAVMAYARSSLGIGRVVAIVDPRNDRSVRLLEKLGMRRAGTIRLSNESRVNALFATAD